MTGRRRLILEIACSAVTRQGQEDRLDHSCYFF